MWRTWPHLDLFLAVHHIWPHLKLTTFVTHTHQLFKYGLTSESWVSAFNGRWIHLVGLRNKELIAIRDLPKDRSSQRVFSKFRIWRSNDIESVIFSLPSRSMITHLRSCTSCRVGLQWIFIGARSLQLYCGLLLAGNDCNRTIQPGHRKYIVKHCSELVASEMLFTWGGNKRSPACRIAAHN